MILDNVHQPIAKETTASDNNKKHAFIAARTETLTDFILEAVNILNIYEDTAFEDFFHILGHEIRRYHYRDCKFFELMQNHDTRSLLAGALLIIRGKSVSFTKANINEMADILRDKTYGTDVTELLDYINSLYRHSEQKFYRILKELKHYRKTKSIKAHNNLVKVIRHGVRDIFFDHYTALDNNTRQELKVRIEKFWNRLKNNEISEPIIDSIKVSKNLMNENKDPEHYPKNDPQKYLRNKRDRKSKENYYQQPQDKETEIDDSSNESEKWNTDTDTTDEIPSGQSFDSSSNSIEQSQERQEEHNTKRYMTLYTEKISYKSKTTKKTDIIPISANEMTKQAKDARRPTTTSTPEYSSEDEQQNTKKVEVLSNGQDLDDTNQDVSESDQDTENELMVKSKPIPRAGQNDDKRKKHGKSKPKSKHKNTHFIGEYNAVIDVNLANTELLKSLGIFKPVPDKKAMRATAEPTPKKPTALTTPPSRYSTTYKSMYRKPVSRLISNISTLLSNGSKTLIQLIKGKKQKRMLLTRRNANNTVSVEDFNKNVIKRIDTLEQDLQQLKQIVNFKTKKYDKHTDKDDAKDKVGNQRNTTLKYNVVRLMKEYEDMNKKKTNDGNRTINTEYTTKNTTYYKHGVINKDKTNTKVIDDKNISQVTKNHINDIKALSKEKNDNSKTTFTLSSVKVKDTTELEPVMTTATAEATTITEGYLEPFYYNAGDPDENPFLRNGQVDPFDHIQDGLNF